MGDVHHDVGLESGLFADFVCSFGPLLTALVVAVGSSQNRWLNSMVSTVAWSPYSLRRRRGGNPDALWWSSSFVRSWYMLWTSRRDGVNGIFERTVLGEYLASVSSTKLWFDLIVPADYGGIAD